MDVTLVLVDLSAGLVCRQTGGAEEGSEALGRNVWSRMVSGMAPNAWKTAGSSVGSTSKSTHDRWAFESRASALMLRPTCARSSHEGGSTLQGRCGECAGCEVGQVAHGARPPGRLTTPMVLPVVKNLAIFSATSRAMFSWASRVEPPMCGVRMTFSIPHNSWPNEESFSEGSSGKTSIAVPPR